MRLARGGPASPAERLAAALVVAGMVGFGIYGFASGAPSTPAYLLSIAALVAVVVLVRKAPLPGALVIALAVDALVHLAGGLVQVGTGGLYNVGLGATSGSWHTRLLQYDHGAHAFGSFLGAVALWVLLAPPAVDGARRRELIVLCVLAGMGIGAFNELIEFIATLAHAGAHVGGYNNTGWDLVSNTVGALVAGVVISRYHERLTTAP
jgi:uncharacterized membrane protein YjdF